MRIVNREQFLAMPEYTLYSEYEPCVWDDINVKHETDGDSYFYCSINDSLDVLSSEEFCDVMFEAEEKGTSVGMCFDILDRNNWDGSCQKYIVYEKDDIEKMVIELNKCLANY